MTTQLIKDLEYQANLNRKIDKLLREKFSYPDIWNRLFSDNQELVDFANWIHSKMGQIWLKKEQGLAYLEWQRGK